jgi:uncharacterized membrane protein
MDMTNILKNLVSGPWLTKARFPRSTMQAIEGAIAASERTHSGELRFAVEAALPLAHLLRGVNARGRAIELFSQLRIWDTEQNNGVLIYLLLAEHDVEIVADRGVHARVGSAAWEAICHEMETEFRAGRFEAGVLAGIARITALLQQHFPLGEQQINDNELPDAPLAL